MMSLMSWQLANLPLPEQYLIPIGAAALLHRLHPQRLPLSRSIRHIAGWSLLAAGSSLAVWSTRAAGNVRLSSPSRLVRTGPYAISRNPMYLAWSLLHLGTGILTASAWIFGALPIAQLLTHHQIEAEERQLRETFGAEYDEYEKAVPRYALLGAP
jgi:protein-S-isoprenylcysteine O-methyltransferase Ste14